MGIPELGASVVSESPIFKTRVICKPTEAVCNAPRRGREATAEAPHRRPAALALPGTMRCRRIISEISTTGVESSESAPAGSVRTPKVARCAAHVAAAEPASAAPSRENDRRNA